jgi:hypothetical protein
MARARSFVMAAALVGVAAAGVSAAALAPTIARASVSIAVSWENLLKSSTDVALATPTSARSAWENGRIYTYTQVHIDRAIAGTLPAGGTAWVRTMGGEVGDIGQHVEGEAVLAQGQPSLLFLNPAPNGAFHVTARAQGQFPIIVNQGQPARVVRNLAAGALVEARGAAAAGPALLASDALHGRSVDDAAREVESAWGRTHVR